MSLRTYLPTILIGALLPLLASASMAMANSALAAR